MSTYNKSISSDVGLLASATVLPGTLQESMIDRDAVDQGLATGLSMAMAFTIALLMQDGIEAVSNQFVNEDKAIDVKRVGIIASAAAIGLGIFTQTVLAQKEKEPIQRSIARTLGYWLAVTGAAGLSLRTLGTLFEDSDSLHSKDLPEQIKESAFIFPFGVLMALLFDLVRYKRIVSFKDNPLTDSPTKAAAAGISIISLLTVLSRTEKLIAHRVQKTIDTYAKPISKGWLPLGHVISAVALGGVAYYGMSKLYRKIETGQETVESAFSSTPTNEFVSGGIGSFVGWNTLSLQGRRHIGTRLPQAKLNSDLDIKNALEPIRIYVGLDSAQTEEERVALALAEIDRTNAMARKYLLLIAPTGTGYVNYVMSDTVEYLAKGNCAMVTMQYAKRPSPLSLDRVDEGHIQFRILVNALAKRLRTTAPDKRPTVLMFGESLGAWVSQDAFLNSGTDGLIANGIDRALWIGTPELSKWQDQVSTGQSLSVDSELVGRFDNIDEYNLLPSAERKQLRYVMCTHHNDPVSHFSLSLLFKRPPWMKSFNNRPVTLPQNTRYRTPTTFVHRMIDMKNALKPKPGIFTSVGHDYRADLLGFINEVFGFYYTTSELTKINELLVRNDTNRGNM